MVGAIIVLAVYLILEYFAFNISGRTTVKLVCVIGVVVTGPVLSILACMVAKDFRYLKFVEAKRCTASDQRTFHEPTNSRLQSGCIISVETAFAFFSIADILPTM